MIHGGEVRHAWRVPRVHDENACARVHAPLRACARVRARSRTRTHAYAHVNLHVHTHAYVLKHTHAHGCTHQRASILVPVPAPIFTDVKARTHMPLPSELSSR
eukprot:3116744-Pleurochrysis_carterae.AAC.1